MFWAQGLQRYMWETEPWPPIYREKAHWCRDSSLHGEEGRTKGPMVRFPGQKKTLKTFLSTQVWGDEWVLASLKEGEDILERGRYASQNSETLTTCLGSKFSLLPSLAGCLNNVLDTYLHAYWLVFKVLLSSFNFIFKALGHLYPDGFWDCFVTLAPTLLSD